MEFWTYPNLLKFLEKRSLLSKEDVHFNDEIIGYVLETTVGIHTDNTICLTKYKESWLQNINFQSFLQKYSPRICIISKSIRSWGPGKVKKGLKEISTWIFDTEDLENKKAIYIRNTPIESCRKKISNKSENKNILLEKLLKQYKELGQTIEELKSQLN